MPTGINGAPETDPSLSETPETRVRQSGVRAGLVALATVAALSGLGTQIAQADTSSPSASAPADKRVGQMASNGESFENLAALSPEEMAKLPFALRMEVKKWQKAQLDATVVSKQIEGKELDATVVGIDTENAGKKATVVSKQIEGKELDATVIKEGTRLLDNYLALKENQGKPGFDQKTYQDIKRSLAKILARGEPQELVEKLKPYEKDITSA